VAHTPLSQLIQGAWRLTATENNIPSYNTMPTIGTLTTLVNDYKFGDIVVDWTATTAEEYLFGQSQGTVTYTLADSTLTTTTKGVASTGQILTLTKDKLRILKPVNNTLLDGPSSSNSIVIFDYIR